MNSIINEICEISFPIFKECKIYMYEIDVNDIDIPDEVNHLHSQIEKMIEVSEVEEGMVYLTVDNKIVKKGETARRGGLHIDGVWTKINNHYSHGMPPTPTHVFPEIGWINSQSSYPGLTIGELYELLNHDGGFLLASNETVSKGWSGEFSAFIKKGGDCECSKVRNGLSKMQEISLDKNKIYRLNFTALHECLPSSYDMERQFIRISIDPYSTLKNTGVNYPVIDFESYLKEEVNLKV